MRGLCWIGALLALVCLAGQARAECSASDYRILERTFSQEILEQAGKVVWMREDESSRLTSCFKMSYGYEVTGRFDFVGAINREDYWVKGRMKTTLGGSVTSFKVEDSNWNFNGAALQKGLALAALACVSDDECSGRSSSSPPASAPPSTPSDIPANCTAIYEQWRAHARYAAFAVASGGVCGSSWNGVSQEEANAIALRYCASSGGQDCRVVRYLTGP